MPLTDAIPPAQIEQDKSGEKYFGQLTSEASPPAKGIYGEPLIPYGKDSMREKTPDGGFIIWKIKPGTKDWRPVQYVPIDNKLVV